MIKTSIIRHDHVAHAQLAKALHGLGLSSRAKRALGRRFRHESLLQFARKDGDAASPTQGPVEVTLAFQAALPVHGQGTVQIELPQGRPFRLVVHGDHPFPDPEGRQALVLDVGDKRVAFRTKDDDDQDAVLLPTTDKASAVVGSAHRYWFSIDRVNRRLRYGKGYPQASLTLFEHELPPRPHEGSADPFAWIDELRYVGIHAKLTPSEAASEVRLGVQSQPVTTDLPPLLIDGDAITLDDIDSHSFAIVQDIGPECARLYANVAGPGVRLSPAFIEALRASIADPRRICALKLAEKSEEFGTKNLDGTYLRITAGESRGNSPGAPFVVEIWPPGHYSPIHSHSDAYAVIKVLHGSITAQLFSELNTAIERPFASHAIGKGDVTWLAPQMYQTHRLVNETREVCVTIQCYSYGDDDHRHYEFFDYVSKVSTAGVPDSIKRFLPNSDWGWGAFQALLLAEYKEKGPYSPPSA